MTMRKPLSILHAECSDGWGGQEIRILTESKGMQDQGHTVILIACHGSKLETHARALSLNVVVLPIFKKRLSSLYAIWSWLRKHRDKIDIINTHSSTDAWLIAIAGIFLPNMPVVVRTRHVSTPVGNNYLTKWLYLNASRHIVTTGKRLLQQLHADNGFPLEHMTSVPTGIDLNRYRPAVRNRAREKLGLANKLTVGIVATLRSWKGHSDLLLAWSRLIRKFTEWQLVIVGHGSGWKRLHQEVETLTLSNSVQFVGNKDNAEEWLQSFDLFVLPSYANEGVPQGIMQAMATGIPVVSTTVGAIAEAVIDQKTGFLVEPRNIDQLTQRLEMLMSNESLRHMYGAASLEFAKSHFGLEAMIHKMENIFYLAKEQQ